MITATSQPTLLRPLLVSLAVCCTLGAVACHDAPSTAQAAEASAPRAPKKSAARVDAATPAPQRSHEHQTQGRRLELVYRATITPGDKDGPVDVFLPIAQSTPEQDVEAVNVHSPMRGEFGTEKTYHNRFWHAHLDALPDKPLTITVTYRVARRKLVQDDIDKRAGNAYAPGQLDKFHLFLKANRRVPVDAKIVRQVIGDTGIKADDTLAQRARKIFDYVVDTMEYKKVGTGWGNGDTYWACSKHYGNCTDFHALFTSLIRHEHIPARFEIGFPVPTDRDHGKIAGYHCWVKFYLPKVGWVPIDASEAKKHPKMHDTYFGTQPADRVQFTVGRDLDLGAHQHTRPLNYFIYPHVEVGGKLYHGVETTVSYKALK